MAQVVDYSWGRVGGTNTAHAQAVAAAGFVGAMRIERLTLTPDDHLEVLLSPWPWGAT